MTIDPRPASTGVPRRRFLQLMATAGAFGVIGCADSGNSPPGAPLADSAGTTSAPAESAAQQTVAPVERREFTANGDRQLVVIELSGGNDGLAMLQPLEAGALHDVRPDLLAPSEELIDAGSGFAWHPALGQLHAAGAAALVGVGSFEPNFSHFEMEQRWWRGESDGDSRLATGFLGRLCDELDDGAPLTGLSFSGAPSPAMTAARAVTVGLSNPEGLWFLQHEDPWLDAYREAIARMGKVAEEPASFRSARGGLSDVTEIAEALGAIDYDDDKWPWSDLGQQLRAAAHVLRLDAGVRVLHVQLGGFDTHVGQEWRHRQLMEELDEAVGVFVADLEEHGLRENTLIATTSEFGRRVEQNDGGTDHGGASTMVLCGPATAGVHGMAPSLTDLDDGNLVATARFEDYYATIAEDWFDIPADVVLPDGGEPVPGLLTL